MNIQVQFSSLKDVRRNRKNGKTKIIIYSILLFFIALNLGGLYIGNDFYKKVFQIDTKKDVDQYESNKVNFNEQRFNSLQREEVSVSSKNNYKLYGTYIKNAKATKDTIILVHELAGSRWSSLKYVDMYLDKGFNVLIYDGRDHGHSGGNNVTYGFYEQNDLDRWVSWVYTKNKGGIIGVHGEDLGASTALLQAKLNESKKKVNFYIVDSSYLNLKTFLTERLEENSKIKNAFLMNILLFYTEKVNQIKNQFKLEEVSPQNVVKDISTPVMFINGEKDTYTSKNISEELYKEKQGIKDLYIAPNAGHGEAYLKNQDEYRDKVYKFIDTVLSQNK